MIGRCKGDTCAAGDPGPVKSYCVIFLSKFNEHFVAGTLAQVCLLDVVNDSVRRRIWSSSLDSKLLPCGGGQCWRFDVWSGPAHLA